MIIVMIMKHSVKKVLLNFKKMINLILRRSKVSQISSPNSMKKLRNLRVIKLSRFKKHLSR